LKREYIRAQEEVKRIQSVPLVIGQFNEAIDEHSGIVGSTTGSSYYVRCHVAILLRCPSSLCFPIGADRECVAPFAALCSFSFAFVPFDWFLEVFKF
jgi:hypothetical protein